MYVWIQISTAEVVLYYLEYTKLLVYKIKTFVALTALQIIKFADYISKRLISLLTSSILRVLQNWLKYVNDTAIFTFTVPALIVLFVKLDITLNDLEPVMLSPGLSLQNCH